MLEIVVKRNGTEEPINPAKINGWAEWAAKHLGGFVDWAGVAGRGVSKLPARASSQDLQLAMIQECLDQKSWAYYRMAARLYIPYLRKKMYGGDGTPPSLLSVHTELQKWGLMRELNYSDAEYEQIETIIEHKRDFNYAQFQIKQIVEKYSLCDRRNNSDSPILGRYFESPQHVYMRLAMALAEDEAPEVRMHHLERWYDHLSCNRLNAPTPNFANLGTSHNGYISCCLYVTDDTEASLGIGDHIARTMTVASAGIGGALLCRSINDPVRGGVIVHQGKIPYYKALAGAVNSSTQNGRGGACTTYFSGYDPEVMTLMNLRSPKASEDKRILTMDFAVSLNKHLVRKAARNEDVFTFNAYTAPDLVEAFYSNDARRFESLYERYERDESFKKEYIPARKIVVAANNLAIETGSLYKLYADEANRHTPFYDPIYSSNLCNEIYEPTSPYHDMRDLYHYGPAGNVTVVVRDPEHSENDIANTYASLEAAERVELIDDARPAKAAQELVAGDRIRLSEKEWIVDRIVDRKPEPEVALCALAAIVPSYIESEEQYADVAYYALKMIDKCIHMSDFPLEHIKYTARQRLSAGVGLTGVAHYMARKRLKYTSVEGKQELHRLAERHAYHLIRASLRLGQELGNAPWMHRTRWPEGWLPIDTYAKAVDSIAEFQNQYDWEQLRQEIIANGGIRNSVVIAHMPTESSSKASGVPNGLYPIRDFSLAKTDNNKKIDWAPTEGDRLKRHYEIAWDIPYKDQLELYAIVQKWTDQGISADQWIRLEGDSEVFTEDLLNIEILMAKYGLKGRYYFNSKTSKTMKNADTGEDILVEITSEHNTSDKCVSGGCDA